MRFRDSFTLAMSIASKMQFAHPAKALASAVGVSAGFFLSMAQVGMLLGWIETTTLPILRAKSDLWVMGVKSPAFDYGSPIPRQRLYQARSVAGVAAAEPLFMAWTVWERPDGRKVNIELIGVGDNLVGGPDEMVAGAVSDVLGGRKVIVDAMYRELLGVSGIGERFEILGRRAEVAGISKGVRTFTASPHIFTTIDDAILYDKRYQPDEITFVTVRCSEGSRVDEVARRLRATLPAVEVLTESQFRWRSAGYWMIDTGIGVTVVITAVLGLIIGGLVISQTLFSLLQDHRDHYATMLALGFETSLLGKIILCQSLSLWLVGAVSGWLVFCAVGWIAESSPVPLRMNFSAMALILAAQAIVSLAAGVWILGKLRRIDPVSVFST